MSLKFHIVAKKDMTLQEIFVKRNLLLPSTEFDMFIMGNKHLFSFKEITTTTYNILSKENFKLPFFIGCPKKN